jgi:hypothetical protein
MLPLSEMAKAHRCGMAESISCRRDASTVIACPPRPVQGFEDAQQVVRNGLFHELCVLGAQPLAETGSDTLGQCWLGARFIGPLLEL